MRGYERRNYESVFLVSEGNWVYTVYTTFKWNSFLGFITPSFVIYVSTSNVVMNTITL